MKISQFAINSVSTVRFGLEECLAAYQAAGFENVELMLKHVKDYLAQGRSVADVKQLLDAHRLRCIGGFETHVAVFAPADVCRTNHDLIVDNAKLLSELGATCLVVGTDGPEDLRAVKDPLGEIAGVFKQVAKRIKPFGITLCLEFNWSPVVKSLRAAAEVARRARVANVGVLFDPAHYYCTPTKFDQLTPENVAWIRHVHVDDMADKPAELSNCNTDRVLPGQGCLDLKGIFTQLEKHGYRGYFSIELFNEKLWAMPPQKAAKIMYKSLLPFVSR